MKIDFEELSKDEELPPEFILEYPHENWDWYELSKNKNISMKFIEENSWLYWNDGLNYNPNLTHDFVLKHIEWNWNIDIMRELES